MNSSLPTIEIPETAVMGPRLPWMKFWVADLLTSSFVLSLSEIDFARYLKLLFRAWDSDTPCFLPNNLSVLARFAGASSLKSFKQTWANIGQHFTPTLDGKYLFNSKERVTFQKQIKLISNSIENGKNNRKSYINQQIDINLGTPAGIPAGIPTGSNLSRVGLQDLKVVQVQKQILLSPSAPARVKFTDASPIVAEIYKAYPRHDGSGAAKKSIAKALNSIANDGRTPEWLLTRVQGYAKSREGEDRKFTPMPATWFNQERYFDDPMERPSSDPMDRLIFADANGGGQDDDR